MSEVKNQISPLGALNRDAAPVLHDWSHLGGIWSAGGGEMGKRLREFDWTTHPLGPPDRWPMSLRVAVGICLNSRFPMFVWWSSTYFNIYNDAYIPMLGKRHPEAFGKMAQPTWSDIWHIVGPQADAVMQRGEPSWNERVLLVMERNGYVEDTYFTWSYSAIPDDAGGIGGMFCAVTEETQRVRAEKERDDLLLRVNTERERLADAFAQSPAFLAVLRGPQHVFEFINERYAKLIGGRYVVGQPLSEALPEVIEQGFVNLLDNVYRSGETYVGRDARVLLYNQTTGAPEEFFLDFVYKPMRDSDGSVVGVLVHGVEVTARRIAEVAAREAENRYRAIFEATRDGLIINAPDGTIVEANPAAFNMHGYRYEEFVGTDSKHLMHPEDARRFNEFSEIAAKGGAFRGEARGVRRDGTAFPVEINGSGFAFNGQPHMLSVVRDITERKRTANRLARLYSVVATLSEVVSPDDVSRVAVEQGIAALGATAGSLALISDDGQRLDVVGSIGYPAESIEKWKTFPIDAPVALADAARLNKAIFIETPEQRLELYPALQTLAASEPTQSSACLPLVNAGKVIGALGLSFAKPHGFTEDDKGFMLALARQCSQALERTRLFAAERSARAEAERANEAKSEFLAVLSHELRTPLTPVLLTVSLLEAHPQLPADIREDVATIRRNVELESQLISDLLDLTRITRGKLQLEQEDVDLHLILRSAIDICQRDASAKLVVEMNAKQHIVRGDSTRLQQIFWNLINNAEKFTPPEGTVTVRTSDVRGGRLRVDVIDSGVGIDPSILPRLFNAFEQGDVRTQRQQAGLGLGLAISKRLAEAHRGSITAHSDGRGKGSIFSVELPIVTRVAPQPAPAAPQSGVSNSTRALSVLLIEDHEPTLSAMTRLLKHLGHRVTGATTVSSAIAAARQDAFDLIVSDLGLPDGSGLDVMRQIRHRYAGRAIALTGYGMESDIAASRDAGFSEHVTKPVDLERLRTAISKVFPEDRSNRS